VNLPGSDELFRPTDSSIVSQPASLDSDQAKTEDDATSEPASTPRDRLPQLDPDAAIAANKRAPSGRTRHDEKITIYVTADELMDLEDTRLALRRQFGLAVDRGRIVREAIHLALEEVDTEGDESALVRRLRSR